MSGTLLALAVLGQLSQPAEPPPPPPDVPPVPVVVQPPAAPVPPPEPPGIPKPKPAPAPAPGAPGGPAVATQVTAPGDSAGKRMLVLAEAQFGLHSYFSTGMTDQNSDGGRAFDGSYFGARLGVIGGGLGIFGLDWTHYGATNLLRTQFGELALTLSTHTLSGVVGLQVGSEVVRFEAGLLFGVAVGTFERTLSVGGEVSGHSSGRAVPLGGVEIGLKVFPVPWLALGARGRAAATVDPASPSQADLGGTFLGVNAALHL